MERRHSNLTSNVKEGSMEDTMDSLTTVLEHLKQKKQDNEFKVNEQGLVLVMGRLYSEDKIKMIKTYRFEGESDPAEEAIIYLIRADDGTIGYSIDTYGIYTNHMNDVYGHFIQKLATIDHSKENYI